MALPPAFPSPLQPGPAGMLVAEAGMHSAQCQVPRRDGQPSEPLHSQSTPGQGQTPRSVPRKAWGEGQGLEGEKSPWGRSWHPPLSSLQVPDLVLLKSATGMLPVGDLLSVLAEVVWECGANTLGACPPFSLAGEDARRGMPRESYLLILPLPLLECVPGQTPSLLLSPIVWGCKSFGWQQGSSSAVHASVLAELPRLPPPTPSHLWAPTPGSSPPPHRPTGDDRHGPVGPWMQLSCRGTPWVPCTQGALSAPAPAQWEPAKTQRLFLRPLALLQPGWVSTARLRCVPPQCPLGSASPLPNTGGLCRAAGLNDGSVWPGLPGREGRRVACLICLPGSRDRGQARLLPQRALLCQS